MSHTLSARSADDLVRDLGSGRPPLVLDVRSPAEFGSVHIRGSYNVPLPMLGEHAADVAGRVSSQTVLVCASGVRAEQARHRLAAEGIEDATVLEGGVTAFEQVGGDVVRGRNAWAMERQVRLVAGSLVLTGILGGRLLDPRVRVLSSAIGAGLTFSALTDTCAMGRALSALPWNRGASELTPSEAIESLPRSTR